MDKDEPFRVVLTFGCLKGASTPDLRGIAICLTLLEPSRPPCGLSHHSVCSNIGLHCLKALMWFSLLLAQYLMYTSRILTIIFLCSTDLLNFKKYWYDVTFKMIFGCTGKLFLFRVFCLQIICRSCLFL